jgi:hypothetical protein
MLAHPGFNATRLVLRHISSGSLTLVFPAHTSSQDRDGTEAPKGWVGRVKATGWVGWGVLVCGEHEARTDGGVVLFVDEEEAAGRAVAPVGIAE